MSPHRRETLHVGPRLRLVRHWLPGRDGDLHPRDVVEHPGSVLILPLRDDGRVVFIHNHRPTVPHPLLELPAGTLEPGEEPERAAGRELEEETGHRAGVLEPLSTLYLAPGTTDERMHVFVARQLTETRQRLDPSERIEVTLLAPQEVDDLILRGALEDAKSVAAWLSWRLKQSP